MIHNAFSEFMLVDSHATGPKHCLVSIAHTTGYICHLNAILSVFMFNLVLGIYQYYFKKKFHKIYLKSLKAC